MSLGGVAVLIAIVAIAISESVIYNIRKDEKSAGLPRARPE